MPAETGPWRILLLGIAGLLIAAPVPAQDETPMPDEALLEFLGTWEDDDGNWIDPLEFEQYQLDESRSEPDEAGAESDDESE